MNDFRKQLFGYCPADVDIEIEHLRERIHNQANLLHELTESSKRFAYENEDLKAQIAVQKDILMCRIGKTER